MEGSRSILFSSLTWTWCDSCLSVLFCLFCCMYVLCWASNTELCLLLRKHVTLMLFPTMAEECCGEGYLGGVLRVIDVCSCILRPALSPEKGEYHGYCLVVTQCHGETNSLLILHSSSGYLNRILCAPGQLRSILGVLKGENKLFLSKYCGPT